MNKIHHHTKNKPEKNNREMMNLEMSEYDCLMRAWQNSQELVRDFEMYSKKVENDDLKIVFKKFAEEEGYHASKFRELINDYQEQ